MKNEERMDCPFCGKEGHLYYNPSKRVFYCFKCGARGTQQALERAGFTHLTGDVLRRDCSYRVGEGIEDPPEYTRLSEQSLRYLLDRGIHQPVLTALEGKIYDIKEGTGILFFYPDEEYWQVRRWSQFAPPRWENPSVAPKSPAQGVTYHFRGHYESSRVCLVEGIGDALRVIPYANVAALLSSNYHDAQLLALLERGYNEATILFDKDVNLTKRLDLISRTKSFFDKVRVFEYGDAKDPGAAEDARLSLLVGSN